MSDEALATWADDALYVGQRICARLQAQMPELRAVMMIDELEGPEPRQLPAAVVLLQAMRPEGDPLRTTTKLAMDWLVLLAVKPIRGGAATVAGNPASSAVAAAKLGPLIPRAVRALQGWKPEGSNQALAWRPGPRPDYARDVTYFPLLFTHQAMTA